MIEYRRPAPKQTGITKTHFRGLEDNAKCKALPSYFNSLKISSDWLTVDCERCLWYGLKDLMTKEEQTLLEQYVRSYLAEGLASSPVWLAAGVRSNFEMFEKAKAKTPTITLEKWIEAEKKLCSG